MLSDKDLERARELCEKATPGSWKFYLSRVYPTMRFDRPVAQSCSVSDGEFIAESRTLMPKLFDEIKRLNGKIAEFIDGENHGERYPPTP